MRMSENPPDPEIEAQLFLIVVQYIARTDGNTELQAYSEKSRKRLNEAGFFGSSVFRMISKKSE